MTEDDRTTAIGLFHYAHSYAASATALRRLDLNLTHPEAPIRFQYNHAIELYLKAFLRLHGLTVKELRSKPYSHDTEAMLKKAEEFGLYPVLPHVVAIERAGKDTIDRYIVTGVRKELVLDLINEACQALHDRIGPDIYKAGGLSRAIIPYG